ncbi:MAG: serine/threonine-protein kinase [Pirellulales bacterium]
MNETPWLAQIPDADHERIATVLDEYLSDLERGVDRSAEELIAQYPAWGDALRQALASLDAVRKVVAAFPSAEQTENLPQLGDYRILREIGRGGMGIVYEARQLSLGRTVALKVLPFAAVLDPVQVQRFQNEAQAAAQLHHPHIVPVFAVGCERGVHYYSMQYIDGRSLDQVVRELQVDSRAANPQAVNPRAANPRAATTRRLSSISPAPTTEPHTPAPSPGPSRETVRGHSTLPAHRGVPHVRAMVELVAQAAEGLHHAHECGVIHRDVKPSNLLVDRRGKLSVADFGLARCQALTQVTTQGQLCGTLRYMSPEQASGRNGLVDARADIYGLGVTLYELLALRTPFDADDRESLLRQIIHESPPALQKLNPAVPADVVTVVQKAMAKEREERYSTAEELAADLRRFLAGQPTLARRPSRWDLTTKWVARRAKLVTACLAIVVCALLLASVVAWSLARSQQRTEIALAEAERHLRVARQVVDDFNADLSEQLVDLPGAEPVRLAALGRAAEFYGQFATYSAGDPRWRFDAAVALAKRAAVLDQLGDHRLAEQSYLEAQQRFTELLDTAGVAPATQRYSCEAALCRANYGAFLYRRGDVDQGRSLLASANTQLSEIAAVDSSIAVSKSLLRVQSQYAETCDKSPSEDEYRTLLQAIELRARRGLAETTDDREFASRLAFALESLAPLSDSPQRVAELFREALELRRTSVQRHPASLRAKLELSATLHRFGAACAADDPRRAASLYGEAHGILETAVDQSPSDHALRSELAVAIHNEGLVALKLGNRARSMELLDDAVRQQEAALVASGYSPKYRDLLKKHQDHRDRVSSAQPTTQDSASTAANSTVVRDGGETP